MKKLLLESEREKHKGALLLDDQRRSSSCRFVNNNSKVERGERGSVSSSFLRFGGSGINSNNVDFCDMKMGSSSCLENINGHKTPRAVKRNFRQRFIDGLRSVFGVSSNPKLKNNGKFDARVRKGGVLNPSAN